MLQPLDVADELQQLAQRHDGAPVVLSEELHEPLESLVGQHWL
ncbi:MAG: hypothetical protein ACXQT6_03390 [Candidatus Methanospirareceae archaeon]